MSPHSLKVTHAEIKTEFDSIIQSVIYTPLLSHASAGRQALSRAFPAFLRRLKAAKQAVAFIVKTSRERLSVRSRVQSTARLGTLVMVEDWLATLAKAWLISADG